MTLAPPPDDPGLSASALTCVDTTYRVPDRFGVDRDELVHVDHVTADVRGLLTGAGAAHGRQVAVGELALRRVDLLGAGDERRRCWTRTPANGRATSRWSTPPARTCRGFC
jgi:hypothetical protein